MNPVRGWKKHHAAEGGEGVCPVGGLSQLTHPRHPRRMRARAHAHAIATPACQTIARRARPAPAPRSARESGPAQGPSAFGWWPSGPTPPAPAGLGPADCAPLQPPRGSRRSLG